MVKRIILASLAMSMLLGAAKPAQYLREQKTLAIGGVEEVWQLVWEGKPRSICGPEDVEMAITCPCTGFAYGEMGKLSLVRKRGGKEVERMALGPLFTDLPADNSAGLAAMQWRPMEGSDFNRASDGASRLFLAEVARRPGPRVMQLHDYDRDGNASEFLVQVSAGPCGHTSYVAVGISKTRPRLHAFGSAAHPDAILEMSGAAWQALLTGGGKQRRVLHWGCGDHGADTSTELEVSAKGGSIRAIARSYNCRDDGSRGALLSTAEL